MKASMQDLIIVLPGILGSALAKDGKTVWDVDVGAIGNALFSLGGSIQDLTLRSDASTNDRVSPTHLLANVHMIPYGRLTVTLVSLSISALTSRSCLERISLSSLTTGDLTIESQHNTCRLSCRGGWSRGAGVTQTRDSS